MSDDLAAHGPDPTTAVSTAPEPGAADAGAGEVGPGAGVDPITGESLGRLAARGVPLVLVGFFLGWLIGAAAAALGVASTYRRSASIVTAGAVAMLVVAAFATVIEVPVDDTALRSSYALDRPVAATAGLLTAIFALVAVVTLASRERPDHPRIEPAPDEVGEPRPGLGARLRAVAPLGAVLIVTGIALFALAPAPPSATREVAEAARQGLGWGRVEDGTLAVDGTEPPLAVVVGAAAPGGAALWTALAGMGAAGLVAVLVARRRSARASLLAAALVGAGLVVVRADLAAALVAAALAGSALLADPDGRTPARAAVSGALFGLAVLSAPSLALVLPLLVVALVVGEDCEPTVGDGAAGLVAALVVIAPWQRWVVERFSTWLPAAELGLRPSTVLAVGVLVAAVTIAHQRRLPGLS